MELRDHIHDILEEQDHVYLTPEVVEQLTDTMLVGVRVWIIEERVAGRLVSTNGMAARPIEVKPNAWKIKAMIPAGVIPARTHSMPREFRIYGSTKVDTWRTQVLHNERTANGRATMLRNAGWIDVEVIPCYQSLTELI